MLVKAGLSTQSAIELARFVNVTLGDGHLFVKMLEGIPVVLGIVAKTYMHAKKVIVCISARARAVYP